MRRKNIVILAALLILCIGMIGTAVYMSSERDKRVVEEAASGDAVASGAGVSGKDGKDYIGPGFEWHYTSDFDFNKIGMNAEEMDALPVYEIKGPENTAAFFQQTAKSFFGESWTKAKAYDHELTENEGAGHQYSYTLTERSRVRKIEGFDTDFKYEDNQSGSGQSVDDPGKQTEKYIQEMKLGIWEENTCYTTVHKEREGLYRTDTQFSGFPVTKYYFDEPETDSVYAFQNMEFTYTSDNCLKEAWYLGSYSVQKKRRMAQKYTTMQDIEEFVKKVIKRVERRRLKEGDPKRDSGIVDPIYQIYTMSDISCRYAFQAKDDGTFAAVPILELTGKEWCCYTASQYSTEIDIAVAINLDTGAVMEHEIGTNSVEE